MMCQLAEINAATNPIGARDRSIYNGQARRLGLKKLRGQIKRLGANLFSCNHRRIRRHHGRPRGMRANAVFDPIGAAMDNAHLTVVDAQGLRGDLRNHRLEALSHRRAASDYFNLAVAMHVDARPVDWTETAFLDIHCNAETDDLAPRTTLLDLDFEFIPMEMGKGLVE